MKLVQYVMMVVLDPSLRYAVGITKKKGPSFLVGKLTFPGGRVEEGEAGPQAASREMLEETGLAIDPSAWVQIDQLKADDREVVTFAAVSDKLFCARTCEQEPVWQLLVQSHQHYAMAQPGQYAPAFLAVLDKALAAMDQRILLAA